jgi:NADPH:quinone reductase-like Zn-dependent oxidoreductase
MHRYAVRTRRYRPIRLELDATSGNPSAALHELADLAAAGQLTVTISETFPMERLADAHTLSQSRHVRGKLIISL